MLTSEIGSMDDGSPKAFMNSDDEIIRKAIFKNGMQVSAGA